MKKLALLIALGAMIGTAPALARHASPNPMMPRQVVKEYAAKDYSYGYSLLPGHAVDTLESPNRVFWYFNYDLMDRYVLRPVAHAYSWLPDPVQTGVGNFFSNIGEINNFTNNILVGRISDSGISLGRRVITATLGILGIFDVASEMGSGYYPMDMSTVLGKAGMEQGPYLMVPVYGMTTPRAVHGSVADSWPYAFFNWPVSVAAWAVRGVHSRAQLIEQEGLVDNALDPYVQTRDIYLMYAEGKVNPTEEGGMVVEDDLDAEFMDEIDDL